jgi:AraC-like DNA-binding protein
MALVVDTAEVAPEERFDLWAEISARVFEPLVLRAPDTRAFSGRLARHELGPLALDGMSADASTATRTPDAIRLDDPGHLNVLLQIEGECFIAQDNREAALRPGDLTFWHSSHPYTIGGDGPFEVLMVRIPRTLLGSHAKRLGHRTAQRIDSATAVAGVVRPYLCALRSGLEADAFDSEARGHLAHSLLELLPTLWAATDAPGRCDDLRERIYAYVDAHLFDPALDSERLAHEHFISRSYLDKLFAADGASVRDTIRRRRLERCRQDLVDPTLAHLSTFDIAVRWGFSAAPHFSRAFKATYGTSPREYRRHATHPTGPVL